ncbi:MAG: hypothetical protein AAF368_12745, partial [Planctomycetota bacterium]
MKLFPLLCLAAFFGGSNLAFAQNTWFVDAAATPPGDGSLATPYASIQFAYDQPGTLSGDILLLAPGEYEENLFFFAKDCTVRGAEGP